MESGVDLDQVAGLISRHAFAWRESGLVTGALTRRDEAAPWPCALREDRSQLAEPDSAGVMARRHHQEGRLVVFRGGRADLDYWGGDPSGEPVTETSGWGDWLGLRDIERLLLRFAGLFK